MMILKYQLDIEGYQEIQIPGFKRVLHVGVQNGTITVWTMEDVSDKKVHSVKFYLFGTGQELPEHIQSLRHVGTVFADRFVWHIFTEE